MNTVQQLSALDDATRMCVMTAEVVPRRLAQPFQEEVLATVDGVRGAIARIQREVNAAAADPALSEVGQRTRVQAAVARESRVIEDFERRLQRDRDAYQAAYERVANGWLVREGIAFVERRPTTPAGDELARLREVRDLLRQLNASDVTMRYLRAVADGDDPELVRAIETAPKSFPMVSPAVAEEARRLRVKASPSAEPLGHQRMSIDLRESVLSHARRALRMEEVSNG